jgi:hypothetical protein
VTEAFFNGLQANAQQAAGQNPVYNKLNDAYNKAEQANRTGTALDRAGAKVAVLDAVKTSIEAILKNPNLSPEAVALLNSTLQKVNADLNNAQNQLNTISGQPTTTVAPTTTSTVTETTATTTVTTQAPTTTTVSIPTTTTTTSVTTTTTTSTPSPS